MTVPQGYYPAWARNGDDCSGQVARPLRPHSAPSIGRRDQPSNIGAASAVPQGEPHGETAASAPEGYGSPGPVPTGPAVAYGPDGGGGLSAAHATPTPTPPAVTRPAAGYNDEVGAASGFEPRHPQTNHSGGAAVVFGTADVAPGVNTVRNVQGVGTVRNVPAEVDSLQGSAQFKSNVREETGLDCRVNQRLDSYVT